MSYDGFHNRPIFFCYALSFTFFLFWQPLLSLVQDLSQVTSQSLTLKDSKRSTQEVKLIWWRKPKDYHPYLNVTDEWARKYAIEETKSLVQSLLGLFPNAKWINNYYNLRLPLDALIRSLWQNS